INHCSDILGDTDNYLIDDEEFEDLADKVANTEYLDYISVSNKNTEFSLEMILKQCEESKNIKISIYSRSKEEFMENIRNSINAIETDTFFKNNYNIQPTLFMSASYESPKYEN